MTPIQINVSVNIGVTDELSQLLTALLTGRDLALKACETRGCTDRIPNAPTATVKLLTGGSQASEVNVETSAGNVETLADNVATPTEVAEEPAEEPQAEVEKSIADRVKDAIERTRKRIEGDDYEYNMQSELRNKWHRKLTAWFKKTSALYGSDKPTLLPDEESCRRFIADCDAVHINGDDLTIPCPF